MNFHFEELLRKHQPSGSEPPPWIGRLLSELGDRIRHEGLTLLTPGIAGRDFSRVPFRGRPDLLLRIDNEGIILDATGPSQSLRVASDELPGRRLLELPSRAISEAFRGPLARINETGESLDFTFDDDSSGRRMHYEARIVPISQTHRIVLIRDLTDLMAALDALERQRSFLRQIIDLNPNFIFAKDREGRFTLVNQAVAAAYGTTVDRLVGRTDADFNQDEQEVAHFRKCDLQVMDSRAEMLIPEERITSAGGEERWLQTIKRPILGSDGRASHVLGVATDITQRKLAEQELDRRTRRIERQVETMIELAMLKGEDRRAAFQRIAELASRTVEVERASLWLFNEDHTGLVCEALFTQGSVATDLPEAFRTADYPGYFTSLESSRMVVVDDARSDPRALEFRSRYLDPLGIASMLDAAILLDGRPAGVICLEHVGAPRHWSPEEQQFAASLAGVAARVLGEGQRRHLEDQLRHSQKMEAIGALAGGVAHDFNNLLTGILGYCGMIEHLVRPEDPMAGYAGEIRKAGTRAAALTRQLLAFSRRQIQDPRTLDLNLVVSEMEGLLQRMIGERHVIATRLAPEAGWIRADRGQLEQILMNLVVNARDAMEHGGRILIDTSVESLDEPKARRLPGIAAGAHACLTVTDTGHGMDLATQARIFEPFFTTKEKGRGTGLGLSTVYGIVQQSQWNIEVESEKGNGTTFRVRIPRAGAAPAQTRTADTGSPAPVSRRTGVTILLVEDEPLVRNLAREFLQQAGYRVLESGSPGEAILSSETHPGPIDLLLTDVMMPQLTGRALFDRLHPLRREMRVLYMSGYTGTAIVQDSVLEQGTCFLPKPFTQQELLARVEEILATPAVERGRLSAG